MTLSDEAAMALADNSFVPYDVWDNDDKLVHGRMLEKQLTQAGFTLTYEPPQPKPYLFNIQESFEVIANSEEEAYEVINDMPRHMHQVKQIDRDVMLVGVGKNVQLSTDR